MGKLVAEYSTSTPPQSPTIRYTATDTLGSPRVITNGSGQVESRRDFMPFGEELFADGMYRTTTAKYSTTGFDAVRQRFTGYQRDAETNLDFAEARYYQNAHGRFTAVDPLLASGKSADPQTFNRYVYGLNNPIVLVDPTGLQAATNVEPCEGGSPGCFTDLSAEIARVDVRAEDEAKIPISYSASVSNTISLRGTPAPGLDIPNAEGLKSVEGIARISEIGSALPVVGVPFAVMAGITRAGQGNFAGAGTNLAMAIPFAKLAKLGNVARVAEEAPTGLALAKELGIAGETAAGISGPKKAIEIAGRKLFPDEITDAALTEVKNVRRLSFTKQLRDYAAYTQGKEIPFFLVTRPGTKLSGPLQRAIDDGLIIHRPKLPF